MIIQEPIRTGMYSAKKELTKHMASLGEWCSTKGHKLGAWEVDMINAGCPWKFRTRTATATCTRCGAFVYLHLAIGESTGSFRTTITGTAVTQECKQMFNRSANAQNVKTTEVASGLAIVENEDGTWLKVESGTNHAMCLLTPASAIATIVSRALKGWITEHTKG